MFTLNNSRQTKKEKLHRRTGDLFIWWQRHRDILGEIQFFWLTVRWFFLIVAEILRRRNNYSWSRCFLNSDKEDEETRIRLRLFRKTRTDSFAIELMNNCHVKILYFWVFKGGNFVDLKTLGELCCNSEDESPLWFSSLRLSHRIIFRSKGFSWTNN